MKYQLIIGLPLLFFSTFNHAQNTPISVYDCNISNVELTQQELDASSQIYGSCYTIGESQDIHIPNDNFKAVFASERITLKKNTHIAKSANSIGETHLVINDNTRLDVVVINYPDLSNVRRYKKLEFGVALPPDIQDRVDNFLFNEGNDPNELNPFVEWDLDIEASFYSSENDWYEVINGFYTRDYAQNTVTHDWDDLETDYPFRIRYAPPFNGKYTTQITIKVKGQLVYQSDHFIFNTVESGDPGYVHVHENNTNLKRGDRMIFPIGQNFPTPGENCIAWGGCGFEQISETLYYNPATGDTIFYGNNLFDNNHTEKAANTVAWNNYLEMIEQYLQMKDGGGSKYFRTIQTPYS